MTVRPGYAIAEFGDPEAERQRLAYQAQIVAAAEERAFCELGLPGEGLVLDVGCGPGYVARRFLTTRPELRIMGVDLEASSLKAARDGIGAVKGDALHLPFADGVFDFAYSRVVMRHLPDPRSAVRSMARVVRPGGGLAVLDVDDGTLVVDPVPHLLPELIDARHRSIRRRGADPFVGRKLHGYAVEARLTDIRVVPMPVTTSEIGPRAFAAIILRPFAETIEPDLMDPSRVQEALQGLDRWCDLPHAFAMTTALVAGGTVAG